MSLLMGGAISSVLGLIGLIFWWADFTVILKGGVPILLLIGGILAVYVGIDDIQDKLREERQKQEDDLKKAREEIEMMPPTRLSDVEKSQRIILEIAKRLESEGRILIIRRDEDQFV